MGFAAFATMMGAGLLAGGLAGFVVRGGGTPIWDLVLGLAGGSAASIILWSVGGASEETGLLTTAVVAFLGAALAVVAQHTIWPADV